MHVSAGDSGVRVRQRADTQVITRKPLVAQPDEVERNPRARSAKIRVAQRL